MFWVWTNDSTIKKVKSQARPPSAQNTGRMTCTPSGRPGAPWGNTRDVREISIRPKPGGIGHNSVKESDRRRTS